MLVQPEDVHKIVFKTWQGLVQYLVMLFVLANAPVRFINMMNDLLGDYLDRFILVCLDDIVLYSSNVEEHIEYLTNILDRIQQYEVYAKVSKCEILKTLVEFLRQHITEGGMTPTEAKLTVLYDWATPKDARDVLPFLGIANYYRGS